MILLALLTILIVINIYQLRTTQPGSDHFFHFAFINSIKANNHKFFKKIISFINPYDYGYPQLLHWLLSFINYSFLQKKYIFIGLIFNVLSFISFYIFIAWLYPFLNTEYSYDKYLFLSGLIYILTPFEFFSWNAKNVGLSARGFGVLLGHIFVYLFISYLLTNNIYSLFLIYFVSFVILISSQFAFQFVIFFSIINSLLFSNIYLFFIPFSSILFMLIIMPNWGVFYLKRQLGHKKMYYKYLSKIFILNKRHSIYRDFIYDFFTTYKRKGLKEALFYIYQNPIIEILIGFPFIIILLFTPIKKYNIHENPIVLLIISSLIIFILTSFRKTRFLGEPQRYVEFVYPLITLLPFIYNINISLIFFLIAISIPPILFESIFILKLRRKKHNGLSMAEKIINFKKFIIENNFIQKNDKIISNNFQVLKYFADSDYKIMNVNITSPFTANKHFSEIFPEKYGSLNIENLIYFIDYYKINYVIIDENHINKKEFINKFTLTKITKIYNIYEFTLYKVCWQD